MDGLTPPRDWEDLLSTDLHAAAAALLGARLVSDLAPGAVTVRITEVEAYAGPDDPASHAFRGRTARTEVMFGPPGRLYVYFVYGMHWCANITCRPDGEPSAVLLRAGEVVDGEAVARSRGPATAERAPASGLARGPAKLARCLGLTGVSTGIDLLDPESPVRLLAPPAPSAFAAGPRVGVNAAADRPWRYWLAGDPSVSAYRAGTRRRDTSPGPGAGGQTPRRRSGPQ